MHLISSEKEDMNCFPSLDPLTPSFPHLNPSREKFEFQCSEDFLPSFPFPTPPTSPVEFCSSCQDVTKEMRWHSTLGPWGELKEISDDELEVDDLVFGEFARGFGGTHVKSPAIVNDIMWSGDRVKRPDSTTDFLARFSLSSSPPHLEAPVTHTFVESEDLFAFSLLSHCQDSEHADDVLARPENGDVPFDLPVQDQVTSDTDEDEIDVVSVAGDKTVRQSTSPCRDTTSEITNNGNTPPRKLRSRKLESESSVQESDEGNARISHNDLERKRRNDLRNRFQCLRKCIPSLERSERAAKISILRMASELIPTLQKEEERLIALKNDEKKRNVELLNTLMKLTKNNKRR